MQEIRRVQRTSRTLSGYEIEPLYGPPNPSSHEFQEKTGRPGEFPFTRGIDPNGYREQLWSMGQISGFGTAADAAARFKALYEHGMTGLGVEFDLPTQLGYDSDDSLVEGEVARVGIALDSLKDMETLVREAPLEQMDLVRWTINAPAPVIGAMLFVAGRNVGKDPAQFRFLFQNDILKEYMARGAYIFPVKPSMRLTCDFVQWLLEAMPLSYPIGICGNHFRGAGCTAAQEMAFAFADGIEYVHAFINHGMTVDRFGPYLHFYLSSHLSLFEEIAKFRAGRRIWARIMRERFEAKDPRSWMLRMYTPAIGSPLTRQIPELNLVRSTVQALSAVLGGTQSLSAASMDEAHGIPTEQAALLSVRLMQVIAHEADVTMTPDPLAGSYFVEQLTDQMEEQICAEMQRIELMGGAVAAMEQGYQQREISRSALEHQRRLERKERLVVGVNLHEHDLMHEKRDRAMKLEGHDFVQRQLEALDDVRQNRDGEAVQRSLEELREAANSRANIMPAVIRAVESYATIGEICGVLRAEFGLYQPSAEF